MDETSRITNRASGPPKANKPTKPTRSPWAIVRDALFRLRDGLAAQAEQIDALNCSRASVSQRMDKVEAIARGSKPKPAAVAAPTQILIGPEEPSACGGKVRRVKFGNAADLYMLVAQPAPSPTLGEMRDALDPDPAPEITVTAPIADDEAAQ